MTLNDLNWHEVNLTRREANMTLRIDVIHTTRILLPGRFFVLNILYGVYIGGRGDFNELFLGKIYTQTHLNFIRKILKICMIIMLKPRSPFSYGEKK